MWAYIGADPTGRVPKGLQDFECLVLIGNHEGNGVLTWLDVLRGSQSREMVRS
jgi:hypothetical protein